MFKVECPFSIWGVLSLGFLILGPLNRAAGLKGYSRPRLRGKPGSLWDFEFGEGRV